MHQAFINKNFRPESAKVIVQANSVIEEYSAQGYNLTLRQIFYQFVSRDLIPNTQKAYKRLGTIISDGRLAGLIDWDAIVDRLREVREVSSWEAPQDIVRACAQQFKIDMWESQSVRIEVWIEKDALVGVIEGVCNEYRVPYLACRGYVSQSAMYQAAMRINNHARNRQEVILLHLGDHDPSGMDMTRDIKERLRLLADPMVDVRRLALNMDEVEEYGPPPNPTKLTDSRSQEYIANYGEDSWELDALEPRTIVDLIGDEIEMLYEAPAWEEKKKEERAYRKELKNVAKEWDNVTDWLEEK